MARGAPSRNFLGPSVKPVARGVAPAGRAGRKNGPLSRGNPLIAPSWFFLSRFFRSFSLCHFSPGQIGPGNNSCVFLVSFSIFSRFFVHCAEPPRAPHLPALQNSPFADLLAFVLSAIECFFLHHHCLVLRLTQSPGGKSPCPGAPFSDRVSEKSRA